MILQLHQSDLGKRKPQIVGYHPNWNLTITCTFSQSIVHWKSTIKTGNDRVPSSPSLSWLGFTDTVCVYSSCVCVRVKKLWCKFSQREVGKFHSLSRTGAEGRAGPTQRGGGGGEGRGGGGVGGGGGRGRKGEEHERRADSDLNSDIIRRTKIIKIIFMFLHFVLPSSCTSRQTGTKWTKTYHLPTMQCWVPSPDSLTTIHTWDHLDLETHMNDSETQSSQVSLTTLWGHSHTEFKTLQLPSS